MATGVGRGRICLTSFSSPSPEKKLLSATILQNADISYTSQVIADFGSKFVCHGNKARSW